MSDANLSIRARDTARYREEPAQCRTHRLAEAPGRHPRHPVVTEPGHPVLAGVPHDWPALLGYNRLAAKTAAQVLVRCDADPLLAVGSHGDGRSAVFASDCAPHWCPPAVMSWPGYNPLWANLLHDKDQNLFLTERAMVCANDPCVLVTVSPLRGPPGSGLH